MKRLLCLAKAETLLPVDMEAATEDEFSSWLIRVLPVMFPGLLAIKFGALFTHEGQQRRPDLALIPRDLSFWYVVEVELLSHSLNSHVLPQVRTFRYGEPSAEVAPALATALSIGAGQAMTLLQRVPRYVAVIANGASSEWEAKLDAIDVRFVSARRFASRDGATEAAEIDGEFTAENRSLGFGTYSETDKAVRFPPSVSLPDSDVFVEEPNGSAAYWSVTKTGTNVWLQKRSGSAAIAHGALMQLMLRGEKHFVLR